MPSSSTIGCIAANEHDDLQWKLAHDLGWNPRRFAFDGCEIDHSGITSDALPMMINVEK
jgi:hypothetical protein